MKVTLLTGMCGPNGNGFPGTVLDIPNNELQEYEDASGKKQTMPKAEYMIANKFARPYDAQLDRKARQHGLVKAAER